MQSRVGRIEQLVNVCFVCHSIICICLTTAHRGPPLIKFSPGQDEGLNDDVGRACHHKGTGFTDFVLN